MKFWRWVLGVLVAVPLLLAGTAWWVFGTASGARFAWARIHTALGEVIELEHLDGSLHSGLVVTGFRYAAHGVTVDVGRFEGRVAVGVLPLAIRVEDARASKVAVDVAPDPAAGPRMPLEARLQTLVLPVELYIGALAVEDLRITPTPTANTLHIAHAELAGSWTEQVQIDRLAVTAGNRRLELSGTLGLRESGPLSLTAGLRTGSDSLPAVERLDASAEITGDLRRYEYDASGTVAVRRFGAFDVDAAGAGDFRGVHIAAAHVAGDTATGDVTGDFNWAGGLGTELDIKLASFEPARVLDGWPAGFPVTGFLGFRYGRDEIAISDASLSLAGTDAGAGGSLDVDLATGRLAADLEWRNVQWPPGAPTPRIQSEHGEARLSGDLDDWHAEGTLAVASPGLPPGRFTLDVAGDRDRASGRILEGDILGGNVSGKAAVSWRGHREFSADLEVADVRTGSLVPEWPGSVSGHLAVEGQVDALRFDAKLADVRGQLRGWPLRADGRVALRDDGLFAQDLVIRHGDAELRLDGSMQTGEGVQFSARVRDIGTYVEGVSGDLRATGHLHGGADGPRLVADIESNEILVDDSRITGSVLKLDATRAYQVIEFQSQLNDQRLAIGAEGTTDDPGAPSSWDGTLTRFSLAEAEGDAAREIHLVQSAPLRVARDAVSLEHACLTGSLEARLCLQVDWTAGVRLDVVAELDSIAVDRVNQFVSTGFTFEQLVTGELRWTKAVNAPLTAFADLEISPGAIRHVGKDVAVLQTGKGTIAFDVRDGALLEGSVALPLPGTGNVTGQFSLADIRDLDNSAINGRLAAELTDIGPLRVLLPTLDQADGRLSADIELGGTARKPVLDGKVRLSDGKIAYRPIGLTLEDFDLDASFDEGRHFELTGSFRAGEGRGTLASSGVYGNGTDNDLVVVLKGERLRLIDVPDLEATANPDLRVGYSDGVIRLDGSVQVPHARISPRSLPATRHTESEDVVIIAGDLPAEQQSEPQSAIKLDGELEVTLGDDVVVDIDLAEARVTGKTRFKWDRNLMPMANGRYDLSGDVQAYGQVLSITEGIIRFSNVPANNPTIRIRAEREIFGNSQIKSAGILIDGNVRRPTVEPYTDPRTTRERALTLLVTGSDFDMEQGVGAIDFGTYIAPRLFVSYGIGLFDQDNVISARYDVGKGFGLKATSGQKESGVDIIYHVER